MSTAVAPTGLTAAEVAARVASGQVNDVPPAPTRTVAEIVRANVPTRLNLLLGSLLVVILCVGPLQDALFGLVLVANTLVGIVQEVRAKRTLDRLALISAPAARATRVGREAYAAKLAEEARRFTLARSAVLRRVRRAGGRRAQRS